MPPVNTKTSVAEYVGRWKQDWWTDSFFYENYFVLAIVLSFVTKYLRSTLDSHEMFYGNTAV